MHSLNISGLDKFQKHTVYVKRCSFNHDYVLSVTQFQKCFCCYLVTPITDFL